MLMDGPTDIRIDDRVNGWKNGTLYRAMPEAGTTKRKDFLVTVT